MIFEIKCKQDDFLKQVCEQAVKELDDFYMIKNRKWQPRIVLVPDRKTIDALQRGKTESWVVGWTRAASDVYVLARQKMNKESSHSYSKDYYTSLIKHELVHIYTQRMLQSQKIPIPRWLNEGLAVYLSGQIYNRKCPDKFKYFLKPENPSQLYGESGFAVKFLIERYGKRKLLKLLKSFQKITSERNFRENFEDVYGFKLNISNFNKRKKEGKSAKRLPQVEG